MFKAKITSLGSFLPEKVVTNEDLAQVLDTNDEWIRSRTGMHKRHYAAENQSASDLAYFACKDALQNFDHIDFIIVATTTPDLVMPSTAAILHKKLELKRNIPFMDIQAVCSGFMYGLLIANALIKSGEAKNVLLVASEVMTRVLDFNDRSTAVLFGDGSGCAVISRADDYGIIDCIAYGNGQYSDLLKTDGGISHKGEYFIKMDGKGVFKHAVTNICDVISEILDKNGLIAENIDVIVPHQANLRIIESVSQKLQIPMEKFILTIEKHANTSAASIPIALTEALKLGRLSGLCLIVSMGSGFTWGAALIKY